MALIRNLTAAMFRRIIAAVSRPALASRRSISPPVALPNGVSGQPARGHHVATPAVTARGDAPGDPARAIQQPRGELAIHG